MMLHDREARASSLSYVAISRETADYAQSQHIWQSLACCVMAAPVSELLHQYM